MMLYSNSWDWDLFDDEDDLEKALRDDEMNSGDRD